jgi:hypothetical protein
VRGLRKVRVPEARYRELIREFGSVEGIGTEIARLTGVADVRTLAGPSGDPTTIYATSESFEVVTCCWAQRAKPWEAAEKLLSN